MILCRPLHECAWCGATETTAHRDDQWCMNKRGEEFCCHSHRRASNEALRQFELRNPMPGWLRK